MSRPEHLAPPELFYGDTEAAKYTANTRIQKIQSEMTERALQLLCLPEWKKPALLLDIGCGSGLSGEILTEEGHEWVGLDISPSMLEVALERDCEGDLLLADAGQGCGFRAGSFDGAISISVLQWLCNADTTAHSPAARLSTFFTSLYACLSRGSRAVFQFYPESDEQARFIMSFATRAGFGGGLVVDFPNSKKAKKFYLVLWVGGEMVGRNGERQAQELPQGLVAEHEAQAAAAEQGVGIGSVKYEGKRDTIKMSKKAKAKAKANLKGREWIMHKKELNKRRGKEVPQDSKYTGRKRKTAF
ncbi:S-adenosyl-L-methionine-dependent methyltransferase [Tilletiaria anomala UBC 951]|uniref:S-adenosyl-L-methionine-dependent methyltransferase n=1 Tax=Tilletiaria anomala (strain ATCC 24038 / CBS 436.72 / UBC 951) TaxID=1037660 RepID=A0A066VKR6_TILAU|nr:S-adenosyl-L-methionine-dependent methyltransferase [Tilletiaria anomala UBC 951]KDN40868.1 S-adenosyl-L-methionine-dependent methyltransferase [Tilletiaria anomala UBC 951]